MAAVVTEHRFWGFRGRPEEATVAAVVPEHRFLGFQGRPEEAMVAAVVPEHRFWGFQGLPEEAPVAAVVPEPGQQCSEAGAVLAEGLSTLYREVLKDDLKEV